MIELDHWQREEMRQRTLNDATLLQRGAFYSSHGVLTLGEYQLQYTSLVENDSPEQYLLPNLIDSLAPPPGPKDEWLDTRVSDALLARYGNRRAIPQPLRYDNTRIRRLLVMGSEAISQREGLGERSMKVLGELVAENEFDLEWHERPTPEQIARVCRLLSQVTARAIGIHDNKSVLDVVEMPYEQRVRLPNDFQGSTREEVLDQLFYYPELFAHRFARAKMENMTIDPHTMDISYEE